MNRDIAAQRGGRRTPPALALLFLALGCARPPAPSPYVVTIDLSEPIGQLGSDDLDVSEPAAAQVEAAGRAALPALERALEVEGAAIRVRAVEVVASIGEPESVPLLIRACSDREPAVRAEALLGLDALADERGGAAVEAALEDPDADVRRAAADACAILCRSRAAFARLVEMALHERPAARMLVPRASLAAALQGEAAGVARSAIVQATAALLDPGAEADLRARAALLLVDLGDERAPALLEAAVASDVDVVLRGQAALALGRVGDARTVRALLQIARKDSELPRAIVCRALLGLAERGVRGARAAHRSCVAALAGTGGASDRVIE